jgi:aryl-alcohol dehydrogenase-like predicted oxidoreductase
MEFRTVGNSGLQVSVVGLGCNNFGRRADKAGTAVVVNAAIDAGITFFDTADVYGTGESEEYLGAAIRGHRQDLVIATKFRSPMRESVYAQGGSRRYIMQAVEASLNRLGTDYIDLYQMHGPDPKTPIDETLYALDALVRSGKVRYIGSSNFGGWQIADADWTSRQNHLSRFISAQNHYSLLERGVEKEAMPSCGQFGIGLIPYFPLASGMLTGKYKRGGAAPEGARLTGSPNPGRFLSDSNYDKVEKLEAVAQRAGTSLLSVAIGGLLAQQQVCSVIAGATKPEQIAANVAAADWKPSPNDLTRIDEATIS